SAAELSSAKAPHPSNVVQAAVGTPSVAEAAALLGAAAHAPAGAGSVALLVPKQKSARATAAVAEIARAGRLSVVGLGPGGRDQLTIEAWESLRTADVVLGYSGYVAIVRDW